MVTDRRLLFLLFYMLVLPGHGDAQNDDGALFQCTFEDDRVPLCAMEQIHDDSRLDDRSSYDWERIRGPTPTHYSDDGSTGPDGAQGSSRDYIYMEATDRSPGMYAAITTPPINDVDGTVCLSFYYHMHGDTMGSLSIFTMRNNDFSRRYVLDAYTLIGNQGDQWKPYRIPVPLYDYNKIGFLGTRGEDYKGDIGLDTIRIVDGACNQPGLLALEPMNLPYMCGFEESGLCGMTQLNIDEFDWLRENDATPTSSTGPGRAQEGQWYIYIESSLPRVRGDEAIIETPRLKLSNDATEGRICIDFWYHMWGDTVESLYVYLDSRGLGSPVWERHGGRNDVWYSERIETDAVTGDKVGFIGRVGRDIESDIAIDNVTISDCTPPSPYHNLPLYCDFEDDFCDLEQIRGEDEFDWIRWRDRTDSANTGPSRAYQGDWYAYIEASGGNKRPGDRAILETPQFDRSTHICVRLAYHIYGDHSGRLTIYTTTDSVERPLLDEAEDHGNRWIRANLYTNITRGDQLIIIGSRGSGVQSDIAIDDLRITEGLCDVPTPTPDTPPTPADGYVTCDIERDDVFDTRCRLVQDTTDDDFDWDMGRGRTPSGVHFDRRIESRLYPVTGPSAARQGTNYLYIEASGKSTRQLARLRVEGDALGSRGDYCLRFMYCMNGYHIGRLSVATLMDNREWIKRWELTGDQKQNWHSAAVDINMNDVRDLTIEGETKGKFSGDIAVDEIQVDRGRCTITPSEFLWQCSFETSARSATLCNMINDQRDDHFDWILWSGSTPSRYTGPTMAYNGNFYVYIEASKPRRSGETAILYIPPLEYSGPACIDFVYNMYGFHIGRLELYTRIPMGGDEYRETALWDLAREQTDLPQWLNERVYIDNLRRDDEICFRATIGQEYSGDIAIDYIRIRPGGC